MCSLSYGLNHLHFIVYLVALGNLFINNIFTAKCVELRWLSGSGLALCVYRRFDSLPLPFDLFSVFLGFFLYFSNIFVVGVRLGFGC